MNRKIVLSAILTAFSIIAFMIENLLPSPFVPSARIGIANIFILFALIILGFKYAFAVVIIKCILGSVLSGNIFAVLYSLPAGIISVVFETLLIKKENKFSIVSISVAGSFINTLVQNIVFCLITANTEFFAYLPYLGIVSIISGAIVGIIIYLIIKFLPNGFFEKYNF